MIHVNDPKYKIGETVLWSGQKLVIQGIKNYQDYCWVYDFFPTKDTILPFHFTAIPEIEITALPAKRWWEFWK